MGDAEDPTDEELLRLLPGDLGALEELYRRHRKAVTAYAVRRCAQPADVADVVASTFLAVWHARETYDPRRGAMLPWLIGIARRQVYRLYDAERRQADLKEALRGQRWDLDEAATAVVERQIDAARDTLRVEAAMAAIHARYREALWLVGYDGLTAQEAARSLGMSASTFRVRLFRARQALRRELNDEPEPATDMSIRQVNT